MDINRYQSLLGYLQLGKYPPGYTQNQKRVLRDASKSFVVKENHLYHLRDGVHLDLDEEARQERRIAEAQKVLVGNEEKERILQEYHAGCGAEHFGERKTQEKISQRYWWPSFSKEVIAFIQNCDVCKRTKTKHPLKRPREDLHPVPAMNTNSFGYRWCIDLVGPLIETPRGNKYIVVATEYLTRMPVAKPLRSMEAEGVARFLFEDVICMFGIMKLLQHGQGPEFDNRLLHHVTELLGIQTAMSSQPQTKRFNQTLIKKLLAAETVRDWDLRLQGILFAYRTSRQESTKKSPYEMTFGCQPRLPVDLSMNPCSVGSDPAENVAAALEDRIRTVNDTLQVCRAEGLANLEKSQQKHKQKRLHGLKRTSSRFKVGDKVLLKNNAKRAIRNEDRLAPLYLPATFGQYFETEEVLDSD